ncbi:hypothetical protein F5B18DRAFT_674351 [Nemania serpens]|nr:hypothetical protein F5B18DRAFT_674351 [Nemania serpens]
MDYSFSLGQPWHTYGLTSQRGLPHKKSESVGHPGRVQETMCTYYYLHYHHVAPCARGVEYAVHYSFCENSTVEAIPNNPRHPVSVSMSAAAGGPPGGDYQLVQLPCDELTNAPEYDPAIGIDYTNPCATGGCLVSQHCASGGCRLDELGGRWICCRCSRGGNTFRWCVHPMRKVPDALCYHVVCRNCRMDV